MLIKCAAVGILGVDTLRTFWGWNASFLLPHLFPLDEWNISAFVSIVYLLYI